jgi:hypothetical protein
VGHRFVNFSASRFIRFRRATSRSLGESTALRLAA